jgi:ketosteroid isomerase-like protein
MTNFVIRLIPDSNEAWMTCYTDTVTSDARDVITGFGRCLARFERSGDIWRIADWLATEDFVQRYGDGSAIAAAFSRVDDPPQSRFQSRAWGPQRAPRFDGGRETWHELRDDVWNAHHWLLDQHVPPPQSSEEELTRLADEIAIREVLSNYAYAHDSLDLSWSASMFTDDAMLINETWVFDGNAEVVGAFRGWNRNRELSFHRFSNPIVRFVPAHPEAWLIAYFHVASATGDARASHFGRYFGRLSKRSGRWQIVDWRIANDARIPLLAPSGSGGLAGEEVAR